MHSENCAFLFGGHEGIFRRTAVCLRVALLLDHVGENSPPDCFLPQALPAPSLFESLLIILTKTKRHSFRCAFHFGGHEEIRTLDFYNANVALSRRERLHNPRSLYFFFTYKSRLLSF